MDIDDATATGGISLGPNRYGKAEVRLVHVDRSGPRHVLTDLTVSTALAGDLAATHLTGDNAGVLPTDSQKNAVYAFARDGVGEPEAFALRLARHFVETVPTVTRARVHVEAHRWEPLAATGWSFTRGGGTRLATVTVVGEGDADDTGGPAEHVVSGLAGVTVLNTTASEFHGFLVDAHTTLAETRDRILATAVDARWRHAATDAATLDATDWAASHADATEHLLAAFAETRSLSLQQTLHAMGRRVLEQRPELAEVRLALPNKHHFLVDLAPFGLDNPAAVYHAADRPYGLIEGTVRRDAAAPADVAWDGTHRLSGGAA